VTFCLGINVSDGLVGIADTRVISGNENISARKVSTFKQGDGTSFFVMTSGLRSVRDKVVTYLEEDLRGERVHRLEEPVERLLMAAQMRRVYSEDGEALTRSGLPFNLHALVGGQFAGDTTAKLYLVYPQANWIEVGQSTPYQIIGAGGYGKPVLDRTLKYDDSMQFALKVGCLAFDSTRISAADVDFPIDVVLYFAATRTMITRRFEEDDLVEIWQGWQDRLRTSVTNLPSQWLDRFWVDIEDGRREWPRGISPANEL
jgi:putative proteasome-type protease